MRELKLFLLISAIVLFIIVFYRWLLRYLHKDEITVKFSFLYPFEKEVFSGKEKIKMDLAEAHTVRAELLETVNGELAYLAFENRLKPGQVEIDLDLTDVESGNYNLKIVMPDQTITRFIRVEN